MSRRTGREDMSRDARWTVTVVGAMAAVVCLAGPATAGLNAWTSGGPGGLVSLPVANNLAIDPQTPSVVYATSFTTGVFKSTDGGASWSPINTGLPSGRALSIVVDPKATSTLYVTIAPAAGTVGGAFKSTDGGASWTRTSNGLPSGPVGGAEPSYLYQGLAIDPKNPSVLYAGSGANPGGAVVYRTQDGAANWTLVNAGLAGASFVGVIAIDPVTTSTVYAGTSGGGVYKSLNSGSTWAPVNTGLTQLFIVDLAIDPGAPGTLYAGTNASGLFKTTNGGGSWAPANNGLPAGTLPAVAVDPSAPNVVYASADCCGVYRSTDRGGSWTPMDGSPLAQGLAVSPSGACLHASATGGVFNFAFAEDPCTSTLPPAPPTTLVAAVLPSSRAVQVGTTATAFVTVLNSGADPAVDVGIALATALVGTFKYNTTDCATNAVTGSDNVPASIPVGAQACYVIAITPTLPVGPVEVAFVFAGTNTPPAPTFTGINTLLLLASATPTADAVALAATASNDGIVHIPGVNGTGAFVVAVANVGIGDTITVSTNTGAAALPVTITLCETNPVTGVCISAVGPTRVTFIGSGATPTFAIFVAGTGIAIPLDPAGSRVFVVFSRTSDGVTVGRTSVAVTTQ